jgi:phospholipase C
MRRTYLALLRTWALIISLVVLMTSLAGCGGGSSSTPLSVTPTTTPTPTPTPTVTPPPTPPPTPPSTAKIQHVVVIFQENRSTDNLFHGLPNADVADSGVNSAGVTVPLTPVALAGDYDLYHTHPAFVDMYDGGKMDGADKIPSLCNKNATDCPGPNLQFRYVNPSDVAPYFQMAEQYTFGDRMFQTNQGPSFPAHQFIIAGTSQPATLSDLFASENPLLQGVQATLTGCTSPATETVQLIDPTGSESATTYPCFEHRVLTDLLDAKGITWRYYTPLPGSIWTAPNAIRHIRLGPDWTNNVILNQKQALLDAGAGQLPQVSWVIPTAEASDHAGFNDGSGPSWVASIVNAIGASPYWSSTAIFITWDDWGGWYDHVAPTIYDSYEYGFRVPLIVVSPYAKAGYVSHVTHDFGSILKFIEEDFSLPSLGTADARADDLSDCFDFSQTPLSFKAIRAKYDAKHFLDDDRPPEPPDND